MRVNTNVTLIIMLPILLAACSKQPDKEPPNDIAQPNLSAETTLAETLYCAGTAQVLDEMTMSTYPELNQWSVIFKEIAAKAQKSATSMKGEDGAAVTARLNEIKEQTRANIKRLDADGNRAALSTMAKETVEKCTAFGLES